ncbi:Anti-sigma-K factor RskA [Lishizhenia tianjinensis]|uniref:Regulator of SigK n=1 Tax=Lishizhenia tianjinensis TaxID=477690 RepID=A0A1I6ZR59_9FLAO|nr:anti-sigma factor [Lishizhenia tianjinensis]SFT65219.1 Anti-sigma-K factor RskA [Lishizhenia tianjinensis]
MKSKEYILSGKLENYVFGALGAEDRLEVERMCALYPEVKKEKDSMEEALAAYVRTLSTRPPAEIKARIMAAIHQLPQEKLLSKVPSVSKGKTRSLAPVLWAASIALIFGFGVNHYLDTARKSEVELAFKEEQEKLIAQKEKYAQAVIELRDSLRYERNYADFVMDEQTNLIRLKGTENFPDASVKIFYNAGQQEYIVKSDKLPMPSADKQYQLWAIVDGKPLDLGVMDKQLVLSDRINFELKDQAQLQAFAITLEPLGGSVNPTLEAMVVIGEVKA